MVIGETDADSVNRDHGANFRLAGDCETVTFCRTASEMDFAYDSLDFEGAFTIDVRGRQGDRSERMGARRRVLSHLG